MADRELKYIVSLQDKASMQAKGILANLRQFNTSFRTTIALRLVDGVTNKLKGISQMMSKQTGAMALDLPAGIITKFKALGTTIAGLFKSDESKKWYEKVFGYFTNLMSVATKYGAIITGVFAAAGAVGVIAMGVATGFLIKKGIALNSEFEQWTVSLQTTLGSLTAAKQQMADILTFAKQAPFTIQQVTSAVTKLAAFQMDPKKWLAPLGNMAAVFGTDLSDATLAAAMAMQGQFRRLLPFGIRLLKADFANGGKYAGMSFSDALLEIINRRFSGGMALQMSTVKGMMTNIKDQITTTLVTITGPTYDVFRSIIAKVRDLLANKDLVASVEDFTRKLSDKLWKVVDVFKSLYNYVKTNLVPSFKEFGAAAFKTFVNVATIAGGLAKTIAGPLLTVIAELIKDFSWLVKNAQWLLIALTGLWIGKAIFGSIATGALAASANIGAAGTASTALSLTLSSLIMKAGLLAAAFGLMLVIKQFIETKNALKEIGSSFDDAAGGAGKLRSYLQDLGKQNGFTLDSMTKAAIAAKDYGTNMTNALEVGTKLAGKANLNVAPETGVRMAGDLAKQFITMGDSAQVMSQKTAMAGDMLVNLNAASKDTGITLDNLETTLGRYPDVVAMFGNNIQGLQDVITQFGVAAKAAGQASPDLSMLFEMLKMLANPSKEMLLTLPSTTWISRTTAQLKDMTWVMANVPGANAEMAATMKSDALEIEDIVSRYDTVAKGAQSALSSTVSIATNVQTAAQATAEATKNSQTASEAAQKAAEATSKAAKDAGKLTGPGMQTNPKLGVVGSTWNAANSPAGIAVAAVVALAGVVVTIVMRKKIGDFIAMATSKTANAALTKLTHLTGPLANLGPEYAGKVAGESPEIALARSKGGRAAIRISTLANNRILANNMPELDPKMLDKAEKIALKNKVASEKLLAVQQKAAKAQLASELAREELTNAEAKGKLKLADITINAQEAYKGISAEIVSKTEQISADFDTTITKIDFLRKGLKAKKWKNITPEIKDFADSIVKDFNGISSAIAKGSKTAAKETTLARRGIAAGILQLFDRGSLKKLAAPLEKGLTPRTSREAAMGYERLVGNALATETPEKAAGRLEWLTFGKYLTRITAKIKAFFMAPFRGGESGAISLEGIGKLTDVLSKNTVAVEDTAIQYAATMKKAEGAFAKYNLPHDVKAALTELGGKPTKEFDAILEQIGAIKFRAAESFQHIPAAEALAKAGITGDALNLAPLTQIIEHDSKIAEEMLSTTKGLSLFAHEMGHAYQANTAEGLATIAEKGSLAKYGGQGLVTPTIFKDEKTAWEIGDKFLEAAQIQTKNIPEFAKTMEESLKTYSFGAGDITDAAKAASKPDFIFGKEAVKAADDAAKITVDASEAAAKATADAAKIASDIATKSMIKFVSTGVNAAVNATIVTDALSFLVKQATVAKTSTGQEYTTGPVKYQTEMSSALAGPGNVVGSITKSIMGVIGTVFTAGQWKGANDWTLAMNDVPKQFMTAVKDFGSSVKDNKKAMNYIYSHGMDVTEYNQAMLDVTQGGKSPELDKLIKLQAEYAQKEPEILAKAAAEANAKLQAQVNPLTTTAISKGPSLYQVDADQSFKIALANLISKAAEAAQKTTIPTQAQAITIGGVIGKAMQNQLKEQAISTEEIARIAAETAAKRTNSQLGRISQRDAMDAAEKQAVKAATAPTPTGPGVDTSQKGFAAALTNIDASKVQEVLKTIQDRATFAAAAIEILGSKSQDYQDILDTLDALIQKNNLDLADLTITLGNVSNAMDLSIAINEMALVSKRAQELNIVIANLNVKLKEEEMAMVPLQAALEKEQQKLVGIQKTIDAATVSYDKINKKLDDATKAYDKINTALTTAQASLDKWMSAPIQGEHAYQDYLYGIDKQLNQLNIDSLKAQHGLSEMQKYGMEGTDVYAKAQGAADATQSQVDELTYQSQLAELQRTQATEEVDHARAMAVIGEEQTAQDILNGMKVSTALVANLTAQLAAQQLVMDKITAQLAVQQLVIDSLTAELAAQQLVVDEAQAVVEKQQAQLDNTTKLITAAQDELELIKLKVDASNQIVENAKAEMAAQKTVYDLQSGITDQKMIQAAQDMAAGRMSTTMMQTLVDTYNTAADNAAAINKNTAAIQNAPLGVAHMTFNKAAVDKELAKQQENQTQLVADLNTLAAKFPDLIAAINPAALADANLTALESIFGSSGSLIQSMATNLAILAKQPAPLASYKKDANGNIIMAAGGILRYATKVAANATAGESGPEAYVPLQSGAIPVTLKGQVSGGNTNITIGDMTFIVRDENDIEDIKKAILALRQGQTNFFSSPNNYSPAH